MQGEQVKCVYGGDYFWGCTTSRNGKQQGKMGRLGKLGTRELGAVKGVMQNNCNACVWQKVFTKVGEPTDWAIYVVE